MPSLDKEGWKNAYDDGENTPIGRGVIPRSNGYGIAAVS
jgi:hypothetical protein